jgi:DNA replication protein DnaC
MHPLLVKLKETQSKGEAYLSASLVIVDEAGYLPVESREAYLFIQFISYRYEKSSTILTLLHCSVIGEYLSLNVYQYLYMI